MLLNKDRDEKDLKIQIKRLKLEQYLPLENSTDFKMPDVKAYCFRSKLYHEKMKIIFDLPPLIAFHQPIYTY